MVPEKAEGAKRAGRRVFDRSCAKQPGRRKDDGKTEQLAFILILATQMQNVWHRIHGMELQVAQREGREARNQLVSIDKLQCTWPDMTF